MNVLFTLVAARFDECCKCAFLILSAQVSLPRSLRNVRKQLIEVKEGQIQGTCVNYNTTTTTTTVCFGGLLLVSKITY